MEETWARRGRAARCSRTAAPTFSVCASRRLTAHRGAHACELRGVDARRAHSRSRSRSAAPLASARPDNAQRTPALVAALGRMSDLQHQRRNAISFEREPAKNRRRPRFARRDSGERASPPHNRTATSPEERARRSREQRARRLQLRASRARTAQSLTEPDIRTARRRRQFEFGRAQPHAGSGVVSQIRDHVHGQVIHRQATGLRASEGWPPLCGDSGAGTITIPWRPDRRPKWAMFLCPMWHAVRLYKLPPQELKDSHSIRASEGDRTLRPSDFWRPILRCLEAISSLKRATAIYCVATHSGIRPRGGRASPPNRRVQLCQVSG